MALFSDDVFAVWQQAGDPVLVYDEGEDDSAVMLFGIRCSDGTVEIVAEVRVDKGELA